MSWRALDLLPEYVIGSLSPEERALVDAELARSPELRAELARVEATWGALADGLTPVPPPRGVKARLLETVTHGPDRYAPLLPRIARFADLGLEAVRRVVAAMAAPGAPWNAGPMPGVQLFHISGGPAVAAADVGFVRFARGLKFPWHRHGGREVNLVIEGTITDHDGTVYRPGDALEMQGGTEHEFSVGADEDALILVVLFGGFEIVPRP